MPGLEPKYRCRVSTCEAGSSTDYYAIPVCDEEDGECGQVKRLPNWYQNSTIGINDRCKVPVVTESGGVCEEGGAVFTDDDGAMCGVEDLVFDRSIMRSTLIEEFQLLCGRLVQIVQGVAQKTLFMFVSVSVNLKTSKQNQTNTSKTMVAHLVGYSTRNS